jgi:hypothetical protein
VKHADSGVLRDLPTDELHAHRCAAWCRRYAKNVVAMRMKGHSSSRFSDADGGGAVDAPARHRPALTSARRTDALYARRFRTCDAGIVSPEPSAISSTGRRPLHRGSCAKQAHRHHARPDCSSGSARPSASGTTAGEPRRPTFTGFGDSSSFRARGTPPRWAPLRSRPS